MRINWLWALLLVVSLMLGTSGVAWAHVVVTPDEVPADDYQVLTVRAPTEKEIPTTQVRVEVPEGFVVSRVEPVPGWEYEFEEEGGIVEAIVWSGGEIQPREFQQFALQARTPQETGEYVWDAYQTYEDGTVVEWVGSEEHAEEGEESDGGPGSVVAVVPAGVAGDEPAPAPEEGPASTPETGIAATPIVAYGGLVLGALALVVAVLALLTRRKAT
jgi:uncharacterized protein YcnI